LTLTWLLVVEEEPSGVNPVTIVRTQQEQEKKTVSFQQEIIILQLCGVSIRKAFQGINWQATMWVDLVVVGLYRNRPYLARSRILEVSLDFVTKYVSFEFSGPSSSNKEP
jgi:hypothetical protein